MLIVLIKIASMSTYNTHFHDKIREKKSENGVQNDSIQIQYNEERGDVLRPPHLYDRRYTLWQTLYIVVTVWPTYIQNWTVFHELVNGNCVVLCQRSVHNSVSWSTVPFYYLTDLCLRSIYM